MKGSDKDTGSWAAPEAAKEPEGKQLLVKASRLLGQGRGLVAKASDVVQGAKPPQETKWKPEVRPPNKY